MASEFSLRNNNCYRKSYLFQDGDGQLLQLAKELKVLLNCAKCQKELEPPISHCMSGHDICSQCKGTSCPFCSAGYAVSSKWMEQVFKLLPKPCMYLDRGCSYVSVNGRHEPICEFRTIKCRVGKDNKCTWSGTVKDWKKHVESEHRDHKVICDRINSENGEGKMNVHFFRTLNWNNYCFYLKCDNKTFLFYMVVNCGEVHYAVRYVPVKSVKDNYFLKLTFSNTYNSEVLYKSAVKINVLEESELLEDVSNYCGTILIEELGFKRVGPNKISMEFTLIRRKVD